METNTIIFQTHMSKWHKVDRFFWLLTAIEVLGFALFVALISHMVDLGHLNIWGYGTSAVMVFLPMLIHLIRFWTVKFYKVAITETHLVFETGWLSKHQIELPLQFLANATILSHDTFWGSLMGYATVKLDNLGVHGDLELVDLVKAKELKSHLYQSARKYAAIIVPPAQESSAN